MNGILRKTASVLKYMNKLTSKTVVRIAVNLEVILENGKQEIMFLTHDINLQELIAMGHFLQKDLHDELKTNLDKAFEDRDDAIAVIDEYTVVDIISNDLNANRLSLIGDEFIPEFRGLHGITY